MSLPSPVVYDEYDQGTDDPRLARAQLATLAAEFNALLTHLGLVTVTSTPLEVGDGLEGSGTTFRVKLDGTTLTRSAAGLKVTTGTGANQIPILDANGKFTSGIFLCTLDAQQQLVLSGVISPTALAANTNDWNPTGLATASIIQISASAPVDLTGLQGGADGRIILLDNVGANAITLKDASTSSSAANRFAFGADFPLAAGQQLAIRYRGSASRWVFVTSINAVPLARTISTTAPITGGGDLSANRTIGHAVSGVTAASYTAANITVDATGHVTAAASGTAGAASVDHQVFLASGTWTKPAGAKLVLVEAVGAGGSGGRNAAAGGGGGGAYVKHYYDASALAATETVTVGAGGAAVSAANGNGNAGGTTTFSSGANLLSAYGGGGGGNSGGGAVLLGGGGGGALTAGFVGSGTSAGFPGWPDGGTSASSSPPGSGTVLAATSRDGGGAGGGTNNTGAQGGDGGNSFNGGGGGGTRGITAGANQFGLHGTSVWAGNGGDSGTPGVNGVQPGGGGGGSSTTSGKGGDGRIIVTTWF